ncbi:MAG: hypothetical protein V3S98_03805, partial [Dehalococcoidia bacterium]
GRGCGDWPAMDAQRRAIRAADAQRQTRRHRRAARGPTHASPLWSGVFVHGTFPVVGPLGGISEEPVVNAIYNRSQVDAVDWDRYPVEDVYLIADAVDLLFEFQE